MYIIIPWALDIIFSQGALVVQIVSKGVWGKSLYIYKKIKLWIMCMCHYDNIEQCTAGLWLSKQIALTVLLEHFCQQLYVLLKCFVTSVCSINDSIAMGSWTNSHLYWHTCVQTMEILLNWMRGQYTLIMTLSDSSREQNCYCAGCAQLAVTLLASSHLTSLLKNCFYFQ